MKKKKVRGANKSTIIKRIKKIIAEFGSFTTADVEANSSPVISTLGKDTCMLAESFYKDNIEAVIYVHDNETDYENYNYEDLDRDILAEILLLAEEWEAINIQTEKRISN